jgi:hypothetical protein
MTDYSDLIQGLLDMKTVDFTGTRVAMDAAAAIEELQWRADNNIRGCQCSDDEACAHVRRAEKAEADLAAARSALRYADEEKGISWIPEHTASIAAARAEGGE